MFAIAGASATVTPVPDDILRLYLCARLGVTVALLVMMAWVTPRLTEDFI